MTAAKKWKGYTMTQQGKRRRGHNEGSIYQRTDGRWVASVTLGNGKRKDVYGSTRREVAERLTRLQHDIQAGLPVVKETQTVEQYLSAWLNDIEVSLRPRSYVRYVAAVRLHILPTLGGLKLAKLSQLQIERLYAAKRKEGLAPATVARIHAVLHKALADAERLELVQRNVASLVRAPRAERKDMMTFSPEQARLFLSAIRGDSLEAFYVLCITTGMRRGEALALHWKDVDLERGTISIRYTLQDLKADVFTFAPPKTEKSRRFLKLTQLAVAALQRHRERQQEQRLAMGDAWQEHDLVFTTANGGPLRGNHILQRQFAPLCERLGLPRIRLHDLRHTVASLLFKNRIPAKVVQEMLGHSTISMTLDIYSHVLPEMQAEAAESLDELLGQGD
jgi:integrase